MPFGGYEDMAACVAANGDKQDPKAFCASLESQAAKAARDDAAKRFIVAKLDEAQNLVFGWASVSIGKDGGDPLVDLQGDIIEPAELEKAAYDFVLHSREANEMHEGEPIGRLVESLFVSPEKLSAMGLTRKTAPEVAMWVGFKVSPAVFAKVKSGALSMFSIEGHATTEAV